MKYLLASTLFITLLTSCGSDGDTKKEEPADTTAKVESRKMGEMKIAYYHQDSLMVHFDYYRTADSSFKVEQTKFQNEIKRREEAYVNWATRKDNEAKQGLLSENDMMNLQQEAQNRQQALAQYQQTRGAELEEKLMKETESISKKIEKFSAQYCEENNIDILLQHSPGGQFTFIHPSMDVSKEFCSYLNQEQENLISGN